MENKVGHLCFHFEVSSADVNSNVKDDVCVQTKKYVGHLAPSWLWSLYLRP